MIKFRHYDLWSTYNSDASNVSTDDICFITGTGVIRTKGTNFISPTTWGTSGQILKSNGSGSTPTWVDYPTSLPANGGSATSALYFDPYTASGNNNTECLQNLFSSIPKSKPTGVMLSHGSASIGFGWFLSGYDYNNAYGGWFISDYDTPSWVGVANGTWTTSTFITSSNIGNQSVNYASTAGSAPASDVYSWAKASTKPSYSYSEISGTPTIPTKVSQLTNDSGFTTNVGTVTGVTVGSGGTNYTPSNGVVTIPAYPTTLPASDVYSWAKASSKPSYSYSEISGTPTIPAAPGTLNTTATTTQSTSSSEALSGTITLHKVSKTGKYSDLIGTPSSLPASDVYNWAKASSKPSYSYSEISGTPSNATTSTAGLMSATDKKKVDNIHEVSSVTSPSGTQTLTPNKFYSFGNTSNAISSLTIALGSPVSGIQNEYMFEFTTGSSAPTISLPNTIIWSTEPSFESSKHYEINIKYSAAYGAYYGICAAW